MISYPADNVSWNDWCASMAELFASNQLGFVPEEQWRDWADGLNSIGYFNQSGVPDQRLFEKWQDWANEMSGIMTVVYQTGQYY